MLAVFWNYCGCSAESCELLTQRLASSPRGRGGKAKSCEQHLSWNKVSDFVVDCNKKELNKQCEKRTAPYLCAKGYVYLQNRQRKYAHKRTQLYLESY